MKTKRLTPRNAAPVQRENTATVSRDGNAIAPLFSSSYILNGNPFAGDDAE
ncbi:MAG: anacyclamide/piricyclamide family prenylated cyclic peptide [Microcystis sp.]